MRIAVVGAGGVGGYFGARLAAAGEDVVFVARGAHLEALRTRGLTLRTGAGEATLPVAAAADPGAVGPVDLVLFCVKSYDAAAAARSLSPLIAPRTVVLALQNGLDHAEVITNAIGPGRCMVGAIQALAVQLVAPGVILHSGGEGKIVFGEPGGGLSERVRWLGEIFLRAGIPHEVSRDMPRVLWEKFLFITGVGGVTALARSGIGPLLASPEGRELLAASCAEIVAVGKAEGVDLGGDAVDRALRLAETFSSDWRSSMARDLEAGRRLEAEALSGAVVRRARKHSLPAPIHQAIYACLTPPQAGGI
jgi:2-dehydropantoate 2-reductase